MEFRIMLAFIFQRRSPSALSLAALFLMSGAVLAQPNSTTSTVKTPEAKIEWLYGQVPALSINGELSPLMQYNIIGRESCDNVHSMVSNFRNVGLHFYTIDFNGTNWRRDGDYDFEGQPGVHPPCPSIDDMLAWLVKADPQAHVMLEVSVDNTDAKGLTPWFDKHPEEVARDETGNMILTPWAGAPKSRLPSYASKVWLKDTADMLRALVRHIRSGPYADRVAGYQPASGSTGEWVYWGSCSPQEYLDYSRPFQVAFQDWAKRKYGGDLKMLNERWHKEFASFDEIRIPTKSERMRTDYGDLLDPQRSQYLIDYVQCVSDVVADAIIYLNKAIKEETGGRSLTCAYYAYTFNNVCPYVQHLSGDFALGKVLDSPYVDCVMSPPPYVDRGVGGASGFMAPEGSVKLRKKFYYCESDIRTFNATVPEPGIEAHTLEDSVAVLKREFARTLVQGCGERWYDFGMGWIGKNVQLTQAIGRCLAIEKECQSVKRATLSGEHSIAVIVSEQSPSYAGLASGINSYLDSAYGCFSHTGVGADFFLFEDLDKIPEDYRCYVIEAALCITDAQKALMDQRLKRNGNVVVWEYAPGITDGRKISLDNVSEITGFKIGMQKRPLVLKVKIDGAKHELLKYLPGPITYSRDPHWAFLAENGMVSNGGVNPVFYAEDGEVLGVLEGTRKAGLAVKKFKDWTSIYSSAGSLPPALLRGIAEYAGLPVVNAFDGDVTYVNDRLVAVHTVAGGERQLNFGPKVTKVRELIRETEWPVTEGHLAVKLDPRSTYLFLTE
jgi:hypothetical protein